MALAPITEAEEHEMEEWAEAERAEVSWTAVGRLLVPCVADLAEVGREKLLGSHPHPPLEEQ